jgi:hypothetical protein
MIYCMGAGVLYIIVLVAILRILKRSAILRDKAYIFDDAPQVEKTVPFLLKPNTFPSANNLTTSRGQLRQETA